MGMFQTVGSNARFGVLDASNIKTIAGAGSAITDAAQITSAVAVVTGANGTVGVRLPKPNKPMQVAVYNSVATNGLLVYPHSGGDINDGTPSAAITIEGKTLATFIAIDDTTWAAIFTANT